MDDAPSLYLITIKDELKSKYLSEIEEIEKMNHQRIQQFNDLKFKAVELLRPYLASKRDNVLSYLDDILTGKAIRAEWGYNLDLKTSKKIQDFFEKTHSDVNEKAWDVIKYALQEFGLNGSYSRHDEGPYILLKFEKPDILPCEWRP